MNAYFFLEVVFLAGAFFATVFLAGAFFATVFLATVFFFAAAIAASILICVVNESSSTDKDCQKEPPFGLLAIAWQTERGLKYSIHRLAAMKAYFFFLAVVFLAGAFFATVFFLAAAIVTS